MELALGTDKYERFVLLQGQDYPLLSPEEIHKFFKENKKYEFCKAKNISVSDNREDYMKCCGYWVQDFLADNFFKNLFRYSMTTINKQGIKYRSASFKSNGEKWNIYHGWAQFALTRDCVKYIVKIYNTNARYNRYMKHRFPPDAIYFHTIIHNSPFKEFVSDDFIERRSGEKTLLNLTYFEYPSIVTVFTEQSDFEWLKNTGCLFVRKVNSTSKKLLDEIDRSFN